MTLTQLRTFALVARLGSLRAAAAELGVSEPAVSAALAALRTDLGDPLVVRAGGGIALTPGGKALAAHAREIVGMADRARREVASAGTTRGRLRVLATAACAEHAVGALLDAFTRRSAGTLVDVQEAPADALARALAEDDCDLTLGAQPAVLAGSGLQVVPFLRWARVLVAAPTHPMAGAGTELSAVDLAGTRWFTGARGFEAGTEEGRWLAGQRPRPDLERCDSETDALTAVRAGAGVLLALAHVVADDLRRGTLVQLPLAGTPLPGKWWASIREEGRTTPAARRLQRFLTTPDATTAMLAGLGAAPRLRRPGPTVRVALWS